MREYIKPEVFSSADLSEGIYANSGTKPATNSSDNGLTVTRGTDVTSGQFRFTVAVSNQYVGKHVKITLNFDRNLTGGWVGAHGSPSGQVFEFEHWQMPQSLDVTVTADSEPKYTGGTIAYVVDNY